MEKAKYSVLVDVDTSDAFYKEYDSKEEADKIFNRFLDILTNDEDETEIEKEESETDDIWTHTVRLYLFENKEHICDYDFEISDYICGERGYYDELL